MSDIWHTKDKIPSEESRFLGTSGVYGRFDAHYKCFRKPFSSETEKKDLFNKIEKLETELEYMRKALGLAKERLKNTILDAEVLATSEYLASRAKETLDEITALEQKD